MLNTSFVHKTGRDLFLIGLVLVFFTGMFPLVATRVIDSMNFERYYTDAAVSMLQSNDYLTPREKDGSLRLHKPPLMYWVLIASYKLFGISFFSSRIWFLVAACATIWLAYVFALRLTGDVRAARMAAVILPSNVLFLTVSARSTQDIFVTLCLFVSAYGFVRLICYDETRTSAFWCAYGGAALGVATKGLLPVVFVFYALVFAYVTRSPDRPFRRVLHGGIICASIVIACSGFLLLVWKHGALVFQQFWGDQAGHKTGLNGSPLRIMAYFLIYVPFFLPWIICLGYLFVRHRPQKPATEVQRTACLFILIWAALLPIIFGLGDHIQDRYLVPAVPLLAIVIAIAFYRFSDEQLFPVVNLLLAVASSAFAAIAVFGVAILYQNGLLRTHFAGSTIVFLSILIIILWTTRRRVSPVGALSLSIFLILPLCIAILSPFTLPDQTAQVVRSLKPLNPDNKPVVVIGTDKLASRLKISSCGKYDIRQEKLPRLVKGRVNPRDSIFVLSDGEARRPIAQALSLGEIATYPSKLSLRALLAATLHGDSKSYIDTHKAHCYVVVPNK